MDDTTKKELQSATFERLIQHLRERKDVQNLDLMNLAGFCRNCLSKWYVEAAKDKNIQVDLDEAKAKDFILSVTGASNPLEKSIEIIDSEIIQS